MGGLTTLAAWKRLNGHHGDIAQLGEHLLCTQGVKGSSPFVSTILQKILRARKVKGERPSQHGWSVGVTLPSRAHGKIHPSAMSSATDALLWVRVPPEGLLQFIFP